MGMLVPHGGEMAAVVPGITLRNDNIQWKKGECPSLMGHLLLRAKKPFPEALQQTFLMDHRLLPKQIPSMMEGITRISLSNDNSLRTQVLFLSVLLERSGPLNKSGALWE